MPDDIIETSSHIPDIILHKDVERQVLIALGLPIEIPLTFEGLCEVYSAWCANVPFDNIRKLINLSRSGEVLSGLDPNDFFENWLLNGSGGTCWPSSNALYSLLKSIGFEVRRVAGSMFDIGAVNHGSVKVMVDGEDWMVDTSMLTNAPLPMDRGVYIHDDPHVGVEVEPVGGSHVVWIDFVPLSSFVPCRLQFDPVDTGYYHERYEIYSRQASPFNTRLYFRKGGPKGAGLIFGNILFSRTPRGLVVREFSRNELCDHLNSAGVSGRLIDEWVSSGWLEASFDPNTQPPAPEIHGVQPSRR